MYRDPPILLARLCSQTAKGPSINNRRAFARVQIGCPFSFFCGCSMLLYDGCGVSPDAPFGMFYGILSQHCRHLARAVPAQLAM